MIVWCGNCEETAFEEDGPSALAWYGHTADRPWCPTCCLWAWLSEQNAIIRWMASYTAIPPAFIRP